MLDLVSSGMSSLNRSQIGLRAATATALLALTGAATACGVQRNTDSGFRPPDTRVIGVIISGKYSASTPFEIGGGPVTLKITNQTDNEIANVKLHPAKDMPGCVDGESQSGRIPANGTGTVTATLVDGTCELEADALGTTQIVVSGERRSGQNTLLLP